MIISLSISSGTHAAHPHMGAGPIVIASQIVLALLAEA